MWMLYDLIFICISVCFLPIYIFRRKFHAGFRTRMGVLPQGNIFYEPIWIHAVSVGEVNAVRPLIEELRKIYPHKQIIISTVTPTGNKVAQGLLRPGDLLTYLPLDVGFIVRSVINRINPSLFILAETEIWPNLIFYLHKKKVPIITVNGRVSEKSFYGYSSIKFLLAPVIGKVSMFCVQSQRDAQRLIFLGASTGNVRITGNMKFDSAAEPEANIDTAGLKKQLGLREDEKLLVAGSTHPGEDELLLAAYKELLKEFPKLRLLIAPRHPERAAEVVNLVGREGFSGIKLSSPTEALPPKTIFILDTIGQLVSYYAIADVVFVGGSLVRKGGQNILEPASLGKPVVFGPYMHNFRDIADLFLSCAAARQVHSREGLLTCLADLLRDGEKTALMARASKELIRQNKGATQRNMEEIKIFCK